MYGGPMKGIATLRFAVAWFALALFAITGTPSADGQSTDGSIGSDSKSNPPTTDEVLKKVDRLVQQNEQLEKQNRELMNEISAMRRALTGQSPVLQPDVTEGTGERALAKGTRPNENP